MPEMAEENKPGGDLDNIRSQTDDLLKSLDSLDKAPKSSTKPSSAGSTQKPSSSSVKNILVAAGSLAGIAVVIIGGLLALEASKQATLSREAELAKQQAIRDQAALAKEKADKEKAAREKAEREREARERKESERLASLRARLKSKGWWEVGSSGLLYRYCDGHNNKTSLGTACSQPAGMLTTWFGTEFYCLSKSCSGVVQGSFGKEGLTEQNVGRGHISLKPNQRRIIKFAQTTKRSPRFWLSRAAGFCVSAENYWERCEENV